MGRPGGAPEEEGGVVLGEAYRTGQGGEGKGVGEGGEQARAVRGGEGEEGYGTKRGKAARQWVGRGYRGMGR